MIKQIFDVLLQIAPIIASVFVAALAYEIVLGSREGVRKAKKIFLYSIGGYIYLLAGHYAAEKFLEPGPKENITAALPYILGGLGIITAIGLMAGVVTYIRAEHRDYTDFIESLQDTVPIAFPVFEGAYIRNPEAWALHRRCVEREGQICVFSYSDFKKYTRFLQSVKLSEKEHEEIEKKTMELRAIHDQRSIFEKDPGAYSKLPAPQLTISFPEVQDAYDMLLKDVARFREQQLHKGIISDYEVVGKHS